MASAGSLIFELAADVAKLRTDMRAATDTITSSLKGISNSVNTIATIQGAQFAAKFARAFADGITSAIEQAAALGRLAERIGTTSESLSALQYAGRFANVSIDELTVGFRGLNKAMIDARDPASNSAAAIRALGLDVDSVRQMDPARAFEEIAGAFSGFADGAEKAAVATQLFGRNGQALIPLLNTGKEGLAAARDEAERLGLIVSTQTAQAMNELNDNMTRLQNVSQGAFMVIAQQLGPALNTLVQTLFDASQEGSEFNRALVFVGTTVSDLILDINQLAREITIAWRELQGYGAAVGQFFSGQFKQAINTFRESARASNEEFERVVETTQNAKQAQRDLANGLIDLGRSARGGGWEAVERPVIRYAEAIQKAGRATRAAKQEVDQFKQIMTQLQDEMRRAQADGDEMVLFQSDPRLLQMTDAQVASLIDLKQQIVDINAANIETKRIEQELARTREDADRAHIAHIDGLRSIADRTLDALDPTREYIRSMNELTEAQQAGFLTATQLADAQAMLADKLQQARDRMDPMKQKLDELKQAVLGWGRQASDTFIDFISGAGNASQSFGEMTASILRDIAKMLLYKNVIEPLFRGIGSGDWSGFGSFRSGAALALAPATFGGNRMAGGPVQPGQFYRVNESPFAQEFFSPNVPGSIARANPNDTPMNVYVTINQQTGTVDSDGDTATAIELAKRMAMVARQVIAIEKRTGGLLAS
jgi:hypothetical protein